MRYTFVNSKYRGDHSDHHQPSGTNKNDTCRHTTGGEQHDTVGTAHTQMHTHTNRALCRWEAAGSNFNLCGAAYDTYNDIAHLRCLCFLYSQPRRHSVKRGFPLHLNLRCWLVRVLFSSKKLLNLQLSPTFYSLIHSGSSSCAASRLFSVIMWLIWICLFMSVHLCVF